jgi:hypothetical protein
MTKSQLRGRREYREALLKWFEKMNERRGGRLLPSSAAFDVG